MDSLWDLLHTPIRIPGGALLAAGAVAGLDTGAGSELETILGLFLGGAVSTAAHATKSAGRVAINGSPEPFTNWLASLAEDALVVSALLAAMLNPHLLLIGLGLFILLILWLLPKLWRGMKLFLTALRHPTEALRRRRISDGESG